MEKEGREESSIQQQQQPWRFDLNGFDNLSFDMNGLDNLSFGDLLGLSNNTSAYYPNQTSWFHNVLEPTGNSEIVQKANETVESLSPVSNDVVEQIIKTPEKQKRKKHRPKVLKEAKPKRERKLQTPRKSVGADGQESKTPRRKYVRKNNEFTPVKSAAAVKTLTHAKKDSEFTPVESTAAVETSTHAKKLCRRVLDFEAENQSERGTIHADETESVTTERQLDSGNQDCLLPAPSTPLRKLNQSKRKRTEPKNNGSNQENVKLLSVQASKRQQGKEPAFCDRNLMGMQYAELSEYQNYCLYFQNLQQEGMIFDAIRSTSFAGQRLEDSSAFDYSFTSQCSANGFLNMEEYGKCSIQGGQQSEFNVFLNKIDTPIKNRTTGHARFRNLSSLYNAPELSEQFPLGCNGGPQQNSNKIFVDTRVTVSKKKRIPMSEKSQTNQKALLLNSYQFPASFAGPPPDQLWKQRYSVEAISEQLRLLDINRETSQTAIVPHLSQGNEIVLFNSGARAIVPLAPVKKRHARPRVDLDDETDRVWKLLLENINSEGIDGSDEQKAKWWEEERNVFRGRADSFIARMHLVQGDRRFTPWKGSVVDSVVGVFLTQNVSDHLSTSKLFHNSLSKLSARQQHFIKITYLDSEESMSNPPHHDQRFVDLNETQPDKEKAYVNSNETSRSSSEISSSAHESVGKTTDLSAHVDLDQKGLNVEVDRKDYECLVDDLFPSEDSAVTCQNSMISDAPQSTDRTRSNLETNSEGDHRESMVKLLHLVSGQRQGRYDVTTANTVLLEESNAKNQYENSRQVSAHASPGDCSSEVEDFLSLNGNIKFSDDSSEPYCYYQQDGDVLSCQNPEMPESSSSVPSTKHKEGLVKETLIPDINESTSCLDVQEGTEKPPGPDTKQHQDQSCKELNPTNAKGKKEKKEEFDWDCLRREAQDREGKREKTTRTMDSVDWEKIRTVDVSEIAETIKSRGMNHKLAERIQDFLNRLVREHGSIDLEWLRDVPPDKAKEYLLSFRGLGLKSVECVRLLTLHHLAFPVDTNVGRIAVRLGWVPLQPLPESLQLHLLEMYPILESIQKYLWPRLCKLDQKTLYELHYQLITFGKVFCTKSKPNCNACPMRGECRHFASAFARLALPGTEKCNETPNKNPLPLHLPEPLQREQGSEVVKHSEPLNKVKCCEPIIEEPASPEPESAQVSIADIEDAFFEDPEEIPTIRLNMDAFTNNLKKIMEHSKELQEGNLSNALVALTAEAASLPMPKLKNISQLRTEHQVYELPDTHPLLAELEKREPDDPCSYLLAIWTPGETADSIEPAVSKCIYRDNGTLCDEETCFSCNSIKEARSQTVRGTILIPCRTAMRGSFPLNGTYFQVNEVFADHASSLNPIDVPRQWLWDLPRRTVYFGTSVPSIFKGLTTETIQQCFWRGYVCVRGFDRKTRGPKPLIARLHFPASKMKSQANPPNPPKPSIT